MPQTVLVKEGWRTSKNYFIFDKQALLKGVCPLKPSFTIWLPLISTSSFFPICWYELLHNVLNHPHLTSRVSRADELLIPFLLLLLCKFNELLILSSFPHFLLWLCTPLLHCLNLLFCAALGSSLSTLSVSEVLLLWSVVGVWQRSWVRNTIAHGAVSSNEEHWKGVGSKLYIPKLQ